MRLQYNAPVILTFALTACAIHLVTTFVFPPFTRNFFAASGYFDFRSVLDYFRLFSHVLGHGSFSHLLGNMTYILLLGPILEERYGGGPMLVMILITALCTSLLNALLFSTGLVGASGIVFMFIILASIVNMKAGTIPITFILVSLIYVGGEVRDIMRVDNISQMAHIVGGACGALFGFILARRPNAPSGSF